MYEVFFVISARFAPLKNYTLLSQLTIVLCFQWGYYLLRTCSVGCDPIFDMNMPIIRMVYLEVNKCAFTFSSEIRQIQCTRTEFWCVQCPRPAGPSALDKHQIQASALDLSHFTSKSKCRFINLIHTWQKNKIICSCLWKIINKIALKCH